MNNTLYPQNGSPSKARSDFLTEATIMGQFDNANVIKLYGVISRHEPIMIVMEYMENGSLENYLKVCKLYLILSYSVMGHFLITAL